jgi:hypothetical protein
MQEEYNVAATQTCDVYTVCSMFSNLCITMISVKERVSTYILMLTRTVTPITFIALLLVNQSQNQGLFSLLYPLHPHPLRDHLSLSCQSSETLCRGRCAMRMTANMRRVALYMYTPESPHTRYTCSLPGRVSVRQRLCRPPPHWHH